MAFLKKRRGIIMGVALLALAAGAAAATLDAWLYRLPDPATTDRDGLFRWLVVADLTEQPIDVRQALVSRFSNELDAGIDFVAVGDDLSSGQRKKMLANAEVLIAEWFYQQARRFRATSEGERPAMVDAAIGQFERWRLADLFVMQRLRVGGKPAAPVEQLALVKSKTDRWIETAPADQRASVEEFAVAVRGRLVARAFWSGLFQSSPKPM